MIPKILIIGSTGKLGIKLLNFCFKNDISINCITCFNNINKLKAQASRNIIRHSFILNNHHDKKKFIKFISEKKFDIVYFLDFGSNSLEYAKILLKNNSRSYLAIANKELIVAGGNFLINQIKKTNNYLIPLDSEHYSLFNSNISNENIKKIFITASGGPFYFDKNINLNNVNFKQVITHPKWKMGINNSIDSSNFINKILEIYELSVIYGISKDKIDFLVSKEAYVHSVILFNDNTITLNCFDNDMLITLVSPLKNFYNFNLKLLSKNFLKSSIFSLEIFNDNRFKIRKYFNFFKKLSHNQEIDFMILNNLAQKKYLEGSLSYNEILDFIFLNLKNNLTFYKLDTYNKILSYIAQKKNDYETVII